jgi:predicted nucleic acid-binding Zn ribbon protein
LSGVTIRNEITFKFIKTNLQFMATCYRCGQPIPSTEFKLRRKVKTGESIRRRYPNPNVSAIQTTYGIRLVCSDCAKSIDWEERQREWKQYVQLVIALLVLIGLLIAKAFG